MYITNSPISKIDDHYSYIHLKDRQDYLRIGDPYPEGVLKILVGC
jgi:hypothetical protein